jgi:hypothetical protein
MESLSTRFRAGCDACAGGVKASTGRSALGGYSKRNRFLLISSSELFVKGTVVWVVVDAGNTEHLSTRRPCTPRTSINA